MLEQVNPLVKDRKEYGGLVRVVKKVQIIPRQYF
jgi:hypothetical protein